MTETTIDLTQIQFSDSDKPLFDGKKLELRNKNFIFARNGSGKSTLSDAIKFQKSDDFDVQVFKGFETLVGENENLDAFSLAVDAGEKEEEIRKINKQLEAKRSEYTLSNGRITDSEDENENLYSKLKASEDSYNKQKKKLDKFYTDSARSIGDISNPQLVTSSRNYRSNNFKNEISRANLLQDTEINQLKQVLKSEPKRINRINFQDIDFDKYLIAVNEIISSKVEERIKIARLDNQEKINFAKTGLYIHEKEQICAFCGNKITDEVFNELESYFSADEVKALQDRIKSGKDKIKSLQEQLNGLQISTEGFYPNFLDRAVEEQKKILELKEEQNKFLDTLYTELENKEKNLFNESDLIDTEVPEGLDFNNLNLLIDENNRFSENLEKEQKIARDKLRYHEIKILLDKFNYQVESNQLQNLSKVQAERQEDFDREKEHLNNLQKEINQLTIDIEKLKPKAEKQAIDRINKKLKSRVQWELDFYENEDSGYYRIMQGDRYRSVKKLSTGEKNIIAFLYFIEKLEEVRDSQANKPKLIVFDDPMSSNDTTMQYLITWELQRLYQGKDKNKYDINKDIMVILTHNVHFYLNVQPHGNFKDDKGRTKYDKNNFYRIDNHKFIKIISEKEDFKTSYEALWVELKDLYDCGHKNSMLNTMRRIIETYMKFNSLKQDKFYKGNEQYLKLFNVNSHSIDDLSAESYSETKEEMRGLFYQIFKENECEEHFNNYWKF
ncbi:AAA family ATPase [Streptococcus orisasini]|uniref:AAA family ATPase n=1 Tax=Streptococcus orisasini TaxID=1080071 RepID=UPI00070C86F1|nr:AAA family ATPase [Streptococcus orisasini]